MDLYPHFLVLLVWFLLKDPKWKHFLKYSVGINFQISKVYFYKSSQHLLFGFSLLVFLGRLKKPLFTISTLWVEELRSQKNHTVSQWQKFNESRTWGFPNYCLLCIIPRFMLALGKLETACQKYAF